MAKFRKKPIVVEAIQFSVSGYNNNHKEIMEFMHPVRVYLDGTPTEDVALVLDTLEGRMRANINDWIIKGIKGEFYPCKQDIFEATYEKVEEEGCSEE